MKEICGDNRFEIIAKAKEHLLDATNIDTSEDEMKVLDDFLFRCWQMGWLVRYDEPSNSEKPNNCEHITEDGVTCAKYPACDDCLDNPLNKVKGSERLVKSSEQTEPTISKMEQVDEPQTDCGDFANRLAYERGVKHAWEVAQKVFDSTVTFYEAEDVAKQITRGEPQTDCPWK